MSRSSTRAAMRIGWRSIRRSRGRSALVVLLVLLPVAGMAAAITLAATVAPTREAAATRHMGVADYALQTQLPGSTTQALQDLLPDGSRVEPASYDDPVLVLPGREVRVNGQSMDLDGLARGMLVITGGRQPSTPDEVAVSASVAALAGVGIGDRVELRGAGERTVVGLVEDPFDIRGRLVLLPASLAQQLGEGRDEVTGSVWWLVALPAGVESSVLDEEEVACGDEGCQFFAVPRTQISGQSAEVTTAILVLGALVLVEVLLIASAAFAVGVRRRQRELGLLAAAGAERRHLAATVMSEGVLLGGLGALLGVAVGVGGIVAASPWLDELTNKRNPPVTIDALALLLAGSLGFVACLVAAAVPAWSAARLPVLVALSGRRPALSPARRILVVGIALVVAGAVLTSTGAAMRLSDPLGAGMLSVIFMVGGAIIGVLGFGACSPWLIERLERLGLVLPPTVRLALRDTARARSRNSPIVTAILAAFAATVALSSYFASNDAAAAANWRPWLRQDQVVVQGEGAMRAGEDAAAGLDATAGAPVRGLIGADGREVYAVMEARRGDEFQTEYGVAVADDELLAALGAEAAAPDLAAGNVVLLLIEPTELPSVTAVVRDADSGDEISAVVLTATVVVTGIGQGAVPEAYVSAATAERLGLAAGEVWSYLIRLPRPVTEADVAGAASFAAQYENTWADASLGPTRSDQLFRILLMVVSLLFALSVTGIAVALGEAESRPDQRTLLAIGADPGIRRRIAAARAGVLALLAGALAVPAGLVPAWGLLGSRGAPLIVPIPEVLAAVVVLPLAGLVGALLLTRGIPAWSALREASN